MINMGYVSERLRMITSMGFSKENNYKFINFNIAEFYASITAELLEKSINSAKSIIEIEDKIINIAKRVWKFLMFHERATKSIQSILEAVLKLILSKIASTKS